MVQHLLMRLAPLLALSALFSCAARPSSLAQDEAYLVTIKTARIPTSEAWYARFAEHTWIDVKAPVGWKRVEILNTRSAVVIQDIKPESAFADLRWRDRDVRIVASWSGEEARELRKAILAVAPLYPHAQDYVAWPGPNSNTFIEWICAEVPGLRAELYPNAVGKDYASGIHAGVSSTGLGVEVETAYLGLQVGLQEGVELHVLGLTAGIGIWPPQLKLPFFPGLPWGW